MEIITQKGSKGMEVAGIDIEDDGETLPKPTAFSEVRADSAADIVTLVDVDFGEYRRKNDRTLNPPVHIFNGVDRCFKHQFCKSQDIIYLILHIPHICKPLKILRK